MPSAMSHERGDEAAPVEPLTTASGERPRPVSGAIITGRYRLRRELGAGRWGTVYLAEDVATGGTVALKLFDRELSAVPEFAGELARLAERAMSVTPTSPRLVTVHGWGRAEDGALYLVSEYINGRSLDAVLTEAGALPLERAVHLGTALAEALDAIHGAGLVHGDVRPQHILVLGEGREETVKLKGLEAAGLLQTEVVARRVGLAAPIEMSEYRAPEEITGRPITSQTDIYRYGLILYAMFTGFSAFSAATPDALRRRQLRDPPVPPRALRGDIGPLMQAQLLQALEKEPERRPCRAIDVLAEDLRVRDLEEDGPEAAPGVRGALQRLLEGLVAGVDRLESGRRRWMLVGLAVWLLLSVAIIWMLAGRPFPVRTSPPSQPLAEAPADAGPTAGGGSPTPGPAATPMEPAAAAAPEPSGEPAPRAPGAEAKPGVTGAKPPDVPVAREGGSRAAAAPPAPARIRRAGPDGGGATPSATARPEGGEPPRPPAPEPRKAAREKAMPPPSEGERGEAVSPDGSAIMDWLFQSSPR
jgi:serine/threonine protein kinase